jgi:hypothetical protein
MLGASQRLPDRSSNNHIVINNLKFIGNMSFSQILSFYNPSITSYQEQSHRVSPNNNINCHDKKVSYCCQPYC